MPDYVVISKDYPLNPANDPDPSHWMQQALSLARRAAEQGEVPVGAVVVCEGEIVGQGYNQPLSSHDPTAHAEIVALRAAASRLQNYRLPGCDLYVTIEPCSMCIGAMIHARIRHLYFGAREPRAGAVFSHLGLHEKVGFNHRIGASEGYLQDECATLLRDFFRARR